MTYIIDARVDSTHASYPSKLGSFGWENTIRIRGESERLIVNKSGSGTHVLDPVAG